MSLDEASWLFAGYFKYVSEPMSIGRLADSEDIPFGCAEYRDALAEHDRIFEIIMSSNHMLSLQAVRRGLTAGETAGKKALYDTMWIIDLVANHLHEYQKVHIPWLNEAYELGYIPGTIVRPSKSVDSGKISIVSRASVQVAGVVVEPEIQIQFSVNTLQYELDSMRMWVYHELVKLSGSGEDRPSRNEMIEIIKDKCPLENSINASSQIIKYEKGGVEIDWSYEALKQFIIRNTEAV